MPIGARRHLAGEPGEVRLAGAVQPTGSARVAPFDSERSRSHAEGHRHCRGCGSRPGSWARRGGERRGASSDRPHAQTTCRRPFPARRRPRGTLLRVFVARSSGTRRATIAAISTGWFSQPCCQESLFSWPSASSRSSLSPGRFSGRSVRSSSTASPPEIAVEDARRAVAAARTGRHFVFFPEGSFTWEPGLRPFRMGAFAVAAEVGLPNLRVAIRGTRSILRSDHWLPRRGRIDVHLGPPLAPAGTGLKRRSDCTTKRGPNSSATAATRSRRRLIVAGQRAQRLFDPRLT